jgi:NADH:ubiquinone oxidoreductase subunit 3 (subunit A)
MGRQRVLFVCTHNSARSQMAEGMLRAFAGERFEVFSAGTEATRVRPEAIVVMRELGIDISGQASKAVQHFLGQPFDWLITVCDDARERFSVKFYMVAILFIVFDLEVIFLVPWAVAMRALGWEGFIVASIFIVILTVGLIYEWKKGALEWD